MPRLRDQTGIDDAQLGLALLFIGAGALPAMLLTGRAVDRWGLRVAAGALVALGLAGVTVALTASDVAGLCAGLLLVGATSGATDVAMNAAAGRAEQLTRRPVITRAHGTFSAFVVVSSLGTGLLNAGGFPVFVPFAAVAAVSVTAGVLMLRDLRPPAGVALAPETKHHRIGIGVWPLLLVGLLGALAFASENAHQSWGAVFLEDELGSGSGLSSLAPAVFAGVVAVTRFAIGGVKPAHSTRILLAGSAAAAGGAVVLAVSSTLGSALVGLSLAAAGTAVLFPTLMGVVSRQVNEAERGRATSLLATVSYLGFLLGPVYVGLWSGAVGLRGAMIAVAALGLALLVMTPLVLRLTGFGKSEVLSKAAAVGE